MLVVSEVKKLLRQGLTDAEIAEQLGSSRYRVLKFRQANNLPSSHKWKADNKIKEIRKLCNKKTNQTELAKKVGLSQNRISEIMKTNEIQYTKKTSKKNS